MLRRAIGSGFIIRNVMVVVEQSRDTDRLSLGRHKTVIVNINLENDTTRVIRARKT